MICKFDKVVIEVLLVQYFIDGIIRCGEFQNVQLRIEL